jgi:cytochrome c nitrite reductase small subunit
MGETTGGVDQLAGRINPFLDGSLGRRLARAARTAYAGRLRHPLVAVLGAAAGTALLALQVSNAGSYLSDAPEACINCHVMNGAYAGWAHSAHREEATCNDCHVPHDPLPRKVLFKMMDGARHTFVFTFHLEPQVMRLNEGAIPVVHRNCVRCHEQLVMQTSPATAGPDVRCWHCHRQTPHGLARSLSTSPHLRRPELPAAGVPRPEAPPRGVPGNDGARQE